MDAEPHREAAATDELTRTAQLQALRRPAAVGAQLPIGSPDPDQFGGTEYGICALAQRREMGFLIEVDLQDLIAAKHPDAGVRGPLTPRGNFGMRGIPTIELTEPADVERSVRFSFEAADPLLAPLQRRF